jgi:hypothetical protein
VPLLLSAANALLTVGIVSAFSFPAWNQKDGIKNTYSKPRLSPSQCRLSLVISKAYRESWTCRWALNDDDDEDDEDEDDKKGPLSKGIDSVSWLPTVIGSKGDNMSITTAKEVRDTYRDMTNSSLLSLLCMICHSLSHLSYNPFGIISCQGNEILPLFPMGGFVYTPNTEHVLNIFEPRYRQMYTDILMNGSKRFVVVTSHPTEQGRFAKTGVLFELDDLKEVSEQTKDQVKYICKHKVTGRVIIHRVLNPEAWEKRETYLKIEGTIRDDSGKSDSGNIASSQVEKAGAVYGAVMEAATTKEESDLIKTFKELVNLQHELEEDVRFTKAAANSLAVKDGPGENGLWQTIRLWQSFVEQRLMARQSELQQEFQEKLKDFLKKEKGLKNNELPRYAAEKLRVTFHFLRY